MMEARLGGTVIPFPARAAEPASPFIGDLRFRTLLGEAAWAALPAATRTRFDRRIADCRAITFAGEIIECRMNRAGRLLAQAARLIGGPLPVSRDIEVPALVSVTEDPGYGGQFWTRIYGRRRGFPQVIHSSKRFCGPTGLEEYVGFGFGIALTTRGRGRGAPFRQRPLFPVGAWDAAAPAALAGAGAAAGQPYRLHPWPLRLRARPSPRSVRRADPADGDVPRTD